MKTVVNEQAESNVQAENKRLETVDKVEGILKTAFLISFALLMAVQVILTVPEVRSSLNREALDGIPLGKQAYLVEPCKMELRLLNMENCPQLKVLVNGEEADAFNSDTVLLELRDGDVVELDASSMLIQARVQISAVSRNIIHLLGITVDAADGLIPVAVANTGG